MNDKTKVLHLTVKKKWFDMIASGEKKEEYRDYKDYWHNRLKYLRDGNWHFKNYDFVEFRNGYKKDAPKVTVKFLWCLHWVGKEEWGAEKGKWYYVIKLGEIIK